MRHEDETGSILEWLIFGIVIVGVTALIAWRFIQVDRDQTEAQRALLNSSLLQTKKKALPVEP